MPSTPTQVCSLLANYTSAQEVRQTAATNQSGLSGSCPALTGATEFERDANQAQCACTHTVL